jgi:predicted component of type VI protein secretion system
MILDINVKNVVTGTTETNRFTQSPVRIGRNQLNDIPIEDPFVSEWHGIIRFEGDSVAYFDMGSTNGTLLDGKRVPKNVAAPLTTKSCLVLGRREVTVSPQALAAPAPEPRSGDVFKTIGLGQQAPAFLGPAADKPLVVSSGRRRASADALAPARAPEPEPAPAPAPEPMQKLLAAFCEAFVGLRKGFEQFGAEVGVRTVNGSTPLHRARSSDEVLAYLLSPSVDPNVAARELIAIFADFGIHHIAMMEGVTEGVRAMLQSIDPRAFELGARGSLFAGAKKGKSQWTAYLEQFDQLVTDDEQLHGAIFCDEFARAYASVSLGDERGAPDRKGADGDDD